MIIKPRIQIQLSPLDRALDRIAKIALVVMLGLALYMFFTLPQTIPTHYNFSGEPDRYGNKAMILILPIIGAGQFFLFTWLNKHPHLFNYPVKITEENAAKQYLLATRTMRVVNVSILLMFTTILLCTWLTTLGYIDGLGTWFVPATIVIFLIPIIVAVSKAFKSK